MFRKDYEQVREQVKKILKAVETKADVAGLIYVLCVWESPFSKSIIEKRVGYFENIHEADRMKDYLTDMYTKYQLPFYITTSYNEIEDGGLFDA